MGLSLSLTNKKTGDVVAEMNWLRNPFGLCNWAEDNAGVVTRRSLWYVTNHWSYKASSRVNRPLFLAVVREYWQAIERLEEGYFFFEIGDYMSLVQPHLSALPVQTFAGQQRIVGGIFRGHKYGIPMYLFSKPCFYLDHPTLDTYKAWFLELVIFAELLQDKNNRFYCST